MFTVITVIILALVQPFVWGIALWAIAEVVDAHG